MKLRLRGLLESAWDQAELDAVDPSLLCRKVHEVGPPLGCLLGVWGACDQTQLGTVHPSTYFVHVKMGMRGRKLLSVFPQWSICRA